MRQLIYWIILLLAACHSSDSNPLSKKPILSDKNIMQSGCLNLELIKNELNRNTRAEETIIDYQPDSDSTADNQSFHLFSAFDQRNIKTSEILDFFEIQQSDCQKVITTNQHQESHTFDIIQSTPDVLTLKLAEPTKKIGTTALKFIRISETEVVLEKTYLSFDAHCRSSKRQSPTVTFYYNWSDSNTKAATIDSSFHENYLLALENYNRAGPLPCKN